MHTCVLNLNKFTHHLIYSQKRIKKCFFFLSPADSFIVDNCKTFTNSRSQHFNNYFYKTIYINSIVINMATIKFKQLHTYIHLESFEKKKKKLDFNSINNLLLLYICFSIVSYFFLFN